MQSYGRKVVIQNGKQNYRDEIKYGEVIFIEKVPAGQSAQKIKTQYCKADINTVLDNYGFF